MRLDRKLNHGVYDFGDETFGHFVELGLSEVIALRHRLVLLLALSHAIAVPTT